MTFNNNDDIIDSRDVIERIEELTADLDESTYNDETEICTDADGETDMTDEYNELEILRALAKEGSDYAPDWSHGETLIRESYFTEYAQQLAEEIGAVNSDVAWPNDHIDWEAAANALKIDYTEIEFDDVTYLIR